MTQLWMLMQEGLSAFYSFWWITISLLYLLYNEEISFLICSITLGNIDTFWEWWSQNEEAHTAKTSKNIFTWCMSRFSGVSHFSSYIVCLKMLRRYNEIKWILVVFWTLARFLRGKSQSSCVCMVCKTINVCPSESLHEGENSAMLSSFPVQFTW